VSSAVRDRLLAVIMLAFAASYVGMARAIEDSLLADAVGAGGVPQGVGLMIGLAAVMLFAKSWTVRPEPAAEGVGLVLLLLGIGIVGTLGEFGSLGQSSHLPVGLAVVALTLLSGWSSTQIGTISWARSLHVGTNLVLLFGFIFVTLTGWSVVQKYLPN